MAHCCDLASEYTAAFWFSRHLCSVIWESPVAWNINSSDSHSAIKASSLWILKSFPNLLDNLLLKCNHEFLPLSTSTLPLVTMKMNKKNGVQDRPWGERHIFKGWGFRRDYWRGGHWSQASPTSQEGQTQPRSTHGLIRILLNVPCGRDGGGAQAGANLI